MSKVREGYKITELGEIPSEWEVKYLKEICEFMNGKAHEDIVDDNGDYILINSKFVSTEGAVSKRVTKNISPLLKDDIAIVMSDIPKGKAFAKCFLVEKDNKYTLNQRIGLIRTNSLVPKYLFYQLNRNAYFLKFDDGVSQTNIRKPDLLQCPVLIPTYKEQQKIASILSTVDEQIDETEQLIVKTKELKKGLMQQLLTKGIGHTEFKQTVLGEIPSNWGLEKLDDLVEKITDGAHKTPTYTNSGIPFLRVTDIQKKEIDWESTKYIPLEEHVELIKRCHPEKGDLLLSKNGTIGIVKVIDWDKEFSIFVSLCLIKMGKNKSNLDSNFLAYYISSDVAQKQFKDSSKQGTVTNLHLVEIKKCKVPVPTLKEQKKIASILSTVDEQIEMYEQEKAKYEELKKGLMQQLLTGQIRVKI